MNRHAAFANRLGHSGHALKAALPGKLPEIVLVYFGRLSHLMLCVTMCYASNFTRLCNDVNNFFTQKCNA